MVPNAKESWVNDLDDDAGSCGVRGLEEGVAEPIFSNLIPRQLTVHRHLPQALRMNFPEGRVPPQPKPQFTVTTRTISGSIGTSSPAKAAAARPFCSPAKNPFAALAKLVPGHLLRRC